MTKSLKRRNSESLFRATSFNSKDSKICTKPAAVATQDTWAFAKFAYVSSASRKAKRKKL